MQSQATPCRAMPEVVPAQKASKKETFEALCKDFNIDNQVLKVFDESPIENLEEFRFYFTTEEQIDIFARRGYASRGQGSVLAEVSAEVSS